MIYSQPSSAVVGGRLFHVRVTPVAAFEIQVEKTDQTSSSGQLCARPNMNGNI